MAHVAGRRKPKRKPKSYRHSDPIHGVDVANQRVELIIRKVDPSELTPPKQHIFSPFRKEAKA